MSDFTLSKSWRVRLSAAGVVALLLVGAVGLKSMAANMHDQHAHAGQHEAHGALLTGVPSPAALAEQVNALPAHLDAAIGLNAQQKAQTMSSVAQASAELTALQPVYQERNQRMLTLLTQENIDVQAIEHLRREQATTGELGSRRVTQLMVELAGVLTPAQRQHFAELANQHQGGHG